MRETELYAPVKAFLESQGYEVKAEVRDCDVVAVRDGAEPVIVELKLQLSLALLLQGVDRQQISDHVYIAVPEGKGTRWRSQIKDAVRLCRRLGLGLLSVRKNVVLAHIDPGPYAPRKFKRRRDLLLAEFQNRIGDPNTGGQVKRKIITAYRQDALRIAMLLNEVGQIKPSVARDTLCIPKAAAILQADHYGWFERIERGVYGLRPHGAEALTTYADVIELLKAT